MLKNLILVSAGSIVGGLGRYFTGMISSNYYSGKFPLGTFLVNLLGSFLIGIFFGLIERNNLLSEEIRLFLLIGFCGGFTTFSSFSLETINLLKNNDYLVATLYVFSSILLGIILTFMGRNILN